MALKILIMGLPGTGKTTLATLLIKRLSAVHFNADDIRKNINKDLGFSEEDRIEQAKRMGHLCDLVTKSGCDAVADFVCPTKKTRQAFNADFIIWVDRIKKGRFKDTNNLFEQPTEYDIILQKGTPQEWVDQVLIVLSWCC